MYSINETETYLKYHTEDLMRQAEWERKLGQIKAIRNIQKSEGVGVSFKIRFNRTPDSRFGQIVIEGELK